MTKKILGLLLATVFLAAGTIVNAQQAKKLPRLGILTFNLSRADENLVSFFQELHRLGWIEGQSIAFEFRTAEGNADRLSRLAAELVQLKVDAILASATPPALAAQKATSTIPIVFSLVADPVGSGLVASLAQPGANITGVSNINTDLAGKRLELLKETFPKLSRVTVLSNPADPISASQLKEVEMAARSLGLQLQLYEARDRKDIDEVASAWAKARPAALYVLTSQMFLGERKKIIEVVTKGRLAALFWADGFVDSGGLISYGTNVADLNRRAATYMDKILKGAKPADLPVEQPKKFEFVINLKAAKQIGVTIPPNLLARADKVIR
jgi:putative ABC transport system substrate-binding protein